MTPSTRTDNSTGLSGIIPVLPTPFTADASLDLESLDRLIEHACGWGAQGLAILGVASEVEKLTADESEAVAEAAARRLAGRLPLVVGVSGADARRAAHSAAVARRVGASAVFAKAPPPSRPEAAAAEVLDYFRAIAEAAALPVMIQNFAHADGEGGVLSLAALAGVVRAEPRIRYVKEETPPPAGNGKISQIRAALGEAVAVFSGMGGITLVDDLRRGAAGNMPGAVLVPALVRIVACWRRGEEDEADRLHARILPLILFRARWGFVPVTKAILHDRGVLKTATVRPPAGGGLDEPARGELRRLVRRLAEDL